MFRVLLGLIIGLLSWPAFAAIPPNECLNLLREAITQENQVAGEFLMNTLEPLNPETQGDALVINRLIEEAAPGWVLRPYLAHPPNLSLVDRLGRTPVQAALFSKNHEALEILRSLGQSVGGGSIQSSGQRPMTFAAIKNLIEALDRLGVDRFARKVFLTTPWKKSSELENPWQGGYVNIKAIVYQALGERETELVDYIQSRSHEIPYLFSGLEASLAEPGHLALALIQEGGEENIPYLRLMRSLGLDFVSINAIALPPPSIFPGERPRVMHDSVFELALTGLISHPFAVQQAEGILPSHLTYQLEPRRQRVLPPRSPDHAMLQFLLDEVEYLPTLKSYSFDFLRSPDLRTLNLVLFHPAFKTYRNPEKGVDFFGSALPSQSQDFYRDSQASGPKVGQAVVGKAKVGGTEVDPLAIDHKKLDLLIEAGFDPLASASLKLWSQELLNATSADMTISEDLDPEGLWRKKLVLDYLASRGYDFSAQ